MAQQTHRGDGKKRRASCVALGLIEPGNRYASCWVTYEHISAIADKTVRAFKCHQSNGDLPSTFESMTNATSNTLFTIQALRTLAAASVVAYHVLVMMNHNAGYSFAFSDIGACGVDLFFAISGFIMIYTAYRSFGQRGASYDFLRRRIIRIVPAYWLYTSIVALLLFFVPHLFSSTKFEWKTVLSSYLFLLSEIRPNETGTILQTGWTLCYEVYFYLMFAILLIFPRNYFLTLAGIIFLFGIGLGAQTELPPWGTVATNPILFEFFFGGVIAFLFINGYFLSRTLAWTAIVSGILSIILINQITFGAWSRVVYWGLPCCAILYGAVSLERGGITVPKLFVALGDSSYSLYLVHPLILPVLGKTWHMLLLFWLPPTLLFLLSFIGTLFAGHVLYQHIEKPLTDWLSRVWPRPYTQVASFTKHES